MASTLQEIEDLWAEGSGDVDAVRKAADDYVAANAAEFEDLKGKTIEELVKTVDVFREAGWKEQVQRVETWLWHHFEPQNIGGSHQATVRIVGS